MRSKMTMFIRALPALAHAQASGNRFELEAGVVGTRNMEIRGYQQGNATEDWSKSGPTVRAEYWRVDENGWNFGLVFQPIALRYRDTFRTDLNTKGKAFRAGDAGTLDYQFPTLRFTANTPLYRGDDGSYFRTGGSAILRYAKVSLSGSGQSFSDTNLILIPVVNVEASVPLGQGCSVFTRSDFLPAFGGRVLLDGLFDVYVGVRKKLSPTNDLDVGVRLFFGGYDPKKPDDYANNIFFNALVVRYTF